MISEVESKELHHEASLVIRTKTKLSSMERGMLRWVVLDPADKVLDVNTKDGLLLEYLYRNMECEICGISSDMEQVKQIRSRLQHADIVYAHAQDIPWREGSFDAVFLRKEQGNSDPYRPVLVEALRVLKPGGQFLMGAACFPALLRQLAGVFSGEGDEAAPPWMQSRGEVLDLLTKAGFQQISWQQVDLGTGVAIGWKAMEEKAEGIVPLP